MAEAPRVSVIVPCFNLGQYLDEAIDSVLSQTFQNFEIVVVDDGSTDPATEALLSNYRRPRTRVVRTRHAGLAAARNLGIEQATGDYICALDADDRLAPTYLEKTVHALEHDPSLTFVSAWLRTFGDEEWEWTPTQCDLTALLREDTVLTSALVRRQAVADVGGYDTAMPVQGDEDWDLWLTLVKRGYRGRIIPDVLFHYRQREGAMSSVSWYGPGHLPLARYRFAKHADAYRAHLVDVFLHQDVETAGLLRRNDELERQITSELEPAVAARREELATLKRRLAATSVIGEAPSDTIASISAHARELEAALREASDEVAALRTSASWRITGPLRAAYGQWLRWRGGA